MTQAPAIGKTRKSRSRRSVDASEISVAEVCAQFDGMWIAMSVTVCDERNRPERGVVLAMAPTHAALLRLLHDQGGTRGHRMIYYFEAVTWITNGDDFQRALQSAIDEERDIGWKWD